MCNKVKKFGLSIKAWLSNSNNLKNTAYIVAIVTLIFTAVQVSIARSELEIARADLEARTRPYLSIEKIGLNNTGDGWISTNITINNLGEIPATRVQFGDISLNGTKMAGTSQPDKDYPARVYTTEDGVTITYSGGLVVTPMYSGLPYDMMFFPQKPNTIELLTLGSVQTSAITEGSVIDIGLNYSWGDKQYEYVATAVMSDGEWRVILERGY
ncbi:MAG: hypothetical protein MUP49_01720 [Dehalococcoidia bacterium]|nr:hypothetical protein [Dehalococcoidia bacterium]